jgi:dolichol-phosphate mannosyltransferase
MLSLKLFSKDTTFLFIIVFSLLLRLLFLSYNSPLWGEEAYYWNYAQHLDFGYLDHPPMVALLIKCTTLLFGTKEWAVRFASPICWLAAAFFSFKLTELISRGAGLYAVALFAILPFFFLQSLIITPDQPLTVCWAAALYYLYRSLLLNQKHTWYLAGVWLGLGLLSKYTIILIGPAALLYMCLTPAARFWFLRKEPYFCALIALLFFTPVLYWNATHEWVSFAFQSTRRIIAPYYFSFPEFVTLLTLFLLPPGLISTWGLLRPKSRITLDSNIIRFFQLFAFFPLCFFALFSFTHKIKFNWIGPSTLALIPWFALILQHNIKMKFHFRPSWLITAFILFGCYSYAMVAIMFERPNFIYQKLAEKYVAWENLSQKIRFIAADVAKKTYETPMIVPLDLYQISSELSFYQQKILAHQKDQPAYTIVGRHILGGESLMYRYWSPIAKLKNQFFIVISKDLKDFDDYLLKEHITEISPRQMLWAESLRKHLPIKPYYYQVVQYKTS